MPTMLAVFGRILTDSLHPCHGNVRSPLNALNADHHCFDHCGSSARTDIWSLSCSLSPSGTDPLFGLGMNVPLSWVAENRRCREAPRLQCRLKLLICFPWRSCHVEEVGWKAHSERRPWHKLLRVRIQGTLLECPWAPLLVAEPLHLVASGCLRRRCKVRRMKIIPSSSIWI